MITSAVTIPAEEYRPIPSADETTMNRALAWNPPEAAGWVLCLAHCAIDLEEVGRWWDGERGILVLHDMDAVGRHTQSSEAYMARIGKHAKAGRRVVVTARDPRIIDRLDPDSIPEGSWWYCNESGHWSALHVETVTAIREKYNGGLMTLHNVLASMGLV